MIAVLSTTHAAVVAFSPLVVALGLLVRSMWKGM